MSNAVSSYSTWGAHRGQYAETFREIGACVVAIEANPELVREIRRHFPGIDVEEVALGSAEGEAVLRLGADTNHSTLSEEWASKIPERWVGATRVRVTTLDGLIARYGTPTMVKIDVEGYESEVLAGLSMPIRTIMFEYLVDLPNVTRAVVRRLEQLAPYRFHVVGTDTSVDGSGLLAQLGTEGSGDIVATIDESHVIA